MPPWLPSPEEIQYRRSKRRLRASMDAVLAREGYGPAERRVAINACVKIAEAIADLQHVLGENDANRIIRHAARERP